MANYLKLPGGMYIFKGKEFVYRATGQIDLKGIVQKVFEVEAMEEKIAPTVRLIERNINKFPFKKERLQDFIIAISEVVQNAIIHGPKSSERKIVVNILYIPKLILCVGVTDSLGPLKIRKLKFDVINSHGQLNLSSCNRGFCLMSALCSLVAYIPHGRSKFKEILLGLEPE